MRNEKSTNDTVQAQSRVFAHAVDMQNRRARMHDNDGVDEMTNPQTKKYHFANPFGQEPMQQVIMVFCREFYDNLCRNGWTEMEAKEFVTATALSALEMRKP